MDIWWIVGCFCWFFWHIFYFNCSTWNFLKSLKSDSILLLKWSSIQEKIIWLLRKSRRFIKTLKVLSSSSDLMSSIIKTALMLYIFLSTSCWAQHHRIEKSFCSPLERICLASISSIKNLISDLCGPVVVDFLLRSISLLFFRRWYRSSSLSHPEKKITLMRSKYLVELDLSRFLIRSFSSIRVASKKAPLRFVSSFPSKASFLSHGSMFVIEPLFNKAFLCLRHL